MLDTLFVLVGLLLSIYYWLTHAISDKISATSGKSEVNKSPLVPHKGRFQQYDDHKKKTGADDNCTASVLPLDLDKQLYHQLQNLEYYPEALRVAQHRLLSLFDVTIDRARASSSRNILNAVPTFSAEALTKFLDDEYTDVATRYKAYLARRKAGGARELLSDSEYAKYWLRSAAPVKYVDGAWLGGVHRVTASLAHRSYTKTLWQILSEELGDGDLQKNHVWVYRQLLQSIGADDIGNGDSKEFISSLRNTNNDSRIWTAAIAQLCISLFPDSFLPEILGFNMSYESLPLHLLITIHELRELNIDPYYFVLHISIDNSHSGHAAMGVNAVVGYIKSLPVVERETAWRRIQAGFLLASELPTTPTPRSDLDTSLEKIFGEKITAAQPMHACCAGKIGGRTGKTLNDWLDPNLYPSHSLAFLRALADSRWIVRGEPEKSKLVRETKWGGRMFGAFTTQEVAVLEAWIRDLNRPNLPIKRTHSYEAFTGVETKFLHTGITRDWHDILTRPSAPRHHIDHLTPTTPLSLLSRDEKTHAILSLLSVSVAPFEYLPSLPAKSASAYGMMATRCLRALYGFLPDSDTCAGMDEVVGNGSVLGVVEIAGVAFDDISEHVHEFVAQLLCASAHPERNEATLVGLQDGFIECVFPACEQLHTQLSVTELQALRRIRTRCRDALDAYVKEKNKQSHWLADMIDGKKAVQAIVSNIVN